MAPFSYFPIGPICRKRPHPVKDAAPTGTQTLLRGLGVVQAVAAGARDLKEIARRIGTTRSTTHRLASCLVDERYLRVVPQVGYLLGPKLIELGFQAREVAAGDPGRAVPGRVVGTDRRHHSPGHSRRRRRALPAQEPRPQRPGNALAGRPSHAVGAHRDRQGDAAG
jgi:hypothetical protein